MTRFLRSYGVELALVAALGVAVLFFGYLAFGLLPGRAVDETFSGDRALEYAGRQMAFGARVTGSQGNLQTGAWLVEQLTGLGWDVVIQEFHVDPSLTGRNIIAVRSPSAAPSAPVLLLSTRYDTRLAADEDPDDANRLRPAPGANDGASGAAVLLELARTLDVDRAGRTVCLAFYDYDANADLPWVEGRRGSVHFAQTVEKDMLRCAGPRAVVAVDQAGAEGARFVRSSDSDPALAQALWQVAADLGYDDTFVTGDELWAETGVEAPFALRGVPAALVQDSTFTSAATMADTLDGLRAETLERVGRTLEEWVEGGER